jgi:hypothetical protein
MPDVFEKVPKRLQKRSAIDVDATPVAIWRIDTRELTPRAAGQHRTFPTGLAWSPDCNQDVR